MDTHTKSNYTNMAELKELMTAPPMTAEQHAAITRKRIKDRRMLEEAKERKNDDDTTPVVLSGTAGKGRGRVLPALAGSGGIGGTGGMSWADDLPRRRRAHAEYAADR